MKDTRACVVEMDNDGWHAGEPAWIRLIPCGTVNSENGAFHFDDGDARRVMDVFEDRGVDIVVDYHHASMEPGANAAAGWIKKLAFRRDEGLYGLVHWTQKAYGLLKAGEYRYLSPTVWLDRETNHVVRLDSVALTHKPAIKGGMPIAAERTRPIERAKIEKENHAMAEEMMTGDPSLLIGRILQALDIQLETTELIPALSAILEAVGKKKPAASEGGEEAEVASSARKALGLAEKAKASEVVVAINSLKQAREGVGTTAEKVKALEAWKAEREADDRLTPHLKANKINPNKKEDVAVCKKLAAENPEAFERLMSERTPYVEPGKTIPPATTGVGAGRREDELIADAVKEHGNNYGEAMVALQRKLMRPHLDAGMANKAARVQCEREYPRIFAV
ncbi:MAG: phage protease [Planctomycetota bacterium]